MKRPLFRRIVLLLGLLLVRVPAVIAQPGTQLWEFPTVYAILASPAIAADGTIYVGSYDRNLYAITPAGATNWVFPLPPMENPNKYDGIYSSAAIGPNGTIYFGAENGNLYALNPVSGSNIWTFPAGDAVYSDPAVGPDGTVYVGSYSTPRSYLYAITNGAQRWRFQAGGGIFSDPVIAMDGTIYFGCDDHNLYALNTNGTQRWTFPTGGAVTASPAIGRDGTVYIGATSHKFFAVNPDGSKQWEFQAGGSINSSAAVGDDGTIYFGSNDQNLYALNPNGTVKWAALVAGAMRSSPALAGDGTIYVGADDGKLYAFDSNGSNLWSFTTGDYVFSSPTIAPNGAVYIGSADGKLYAVSGTSALGRTPWPMFRHDPRLSATALPLVNTPPMISTLNNQSMDEDTTLGPLDFVIGDAETPAVSLLVTGSAADSVLVPSGQFQLSGVGSNRFLSITPATNQYGTTTITLMVTDAAGATNSTSFVLTVIPPNRAPTLALVPDQMVDEGTTLSITNIASDPDQPGQTLTFTLLDGPTNAALDALTGVFTWTPIETQGPGTNAVTVVVSDDGAPCLSATQTFQVFVREVNRAPALTAPPNRIIHQGMTLICGLSGTDADLPANLLTYSLSNPPSGASVDASAGLFTWTPTADQLNTTNEITAIVTDAGGLSAATNFIVTVVSRPVVESIHSGANGIVVRWNSILDNRYRLEYATNLEAAIWFGLPGDIQATADSAEKTDSSPTDQPRFYRVLALP